jgi:hypothetical protein|tara:strand:- start:1798 stop:2154 length:357 start_codon:yes stop_codon:yes gene_type:complete
MKNQGWLKIILVSCSISLCQLAIAKDAPKVEYFVQGCNELVQIYKTRSEQRLLAAQTTSLSEALRAGYCKGVIEMYKQQHDYYCSADWYEIADFVSKQLGSESKFGRIESLLEIGCNE